MKDYFSQISYIMIETNSSCNLKCSFCNREELVEKGLRSFKSLSPEEFKSNLLQFQSCNIDTIKIEGISEPMLHKEFDICAKYTRELFPDAFIIIATNLQYNIEKTAFKKTLQYVDMVYLSIDGVNETYESSRPGSSYKKLLTSLEWIKENTTVHEKEKLHINFTLTEYNYHQLTEIYYLRDQYQLKSVRINLAQNWSEDQYNQRDFHPELLKAVEQYKEDLKGVPNWSYNKCFWPYEGIIIDVYGDIRQCIINTSQIPLGNIHKDNIKEIYNNSLHYKEVRNNLNMNQAHASCKTCDYKILSPYLEKIQGNNAKNIKPREFKK